MPFTAAEMNAAIGRLKSGKAAGLDGLVTDHLKCAVENIVIWLNVMNAIVDSSRYFVTE